MKRGLEEQSLWLPTREVQPVLRVILLIALFSSKTRSFSVSFPSAGSEPGAGLAEKPEVAGLEGLEGLEEDEQNLLKSEQQFLNLAQSRLHWQEFFMEKGAPHFPSQEEGFFTLQVDE